MKTDLPSNWQRKARQTGFVLVLAVFMLVSLAAIAAYLLTISTLQVQTAVQDELSVRAYQSARTGVDWAAYQVLRAPGQPFATSCAGGSSTQTIALAGQLAGFSVAVACQAGATPPQLRRRNNTRCDLHASKKTGRWEYFFVKDPKRLSHPIF